MISMQSDVVVVGGGAGGMAAALAAAQKGAKVVVLEKASRIGGVANGGQGPFAVNTLQQRRMQRVVTEEEAFHQFMEFSHWESNPGLISAFVRKSSDTLKWLEAVGCEFETIVAYVHGGNHTWHVRNEEKGFITDRLYDAAKQLGTEVHLNTTVTSLICEDEQVKGVKAENADGEVIVVHANAVVISTGGFASNADMVKKYTKFELNKNLNFWDKNLDGDGLNMAWAIGAAKSNMFFDAYVSLLPNHLGGPGGSIAPLRIFRQPNLLVNATARRFTDESVMGNGAYAANTVQQQPGMHMYMILSENIVEHYLKNGFPYCLPSRDPFTGKFEDWPIEFIETIEKEALTCKDLFVADSVEDLAIQSGLDPVILKETVEEYNQMCVEGEDTKFFKRREYLRPIVGKIYAARLYSGGYATLGGLNINEKAQVLREDGSVIRGLYAAGNDANTVCKDTYMFEMPGLTSGFAYNTGRIAGEYAADYKK